MAALENLYLPYGPQIRDLTKTVILDFVETGILSPEVGVEQLNLIGYDESAAMALVYGKLGMEADQRP